MPVLTWAEIQSLQLMQMYKVLTMSDSYCMLLLTVHVGNVIEINEPTGGGKRIQTFQLMSSVAFAASTYSESIVFKLKPMLGEGNWLMGTGKSLSKEITLQLCVTPCALVDIYQHFEENCNLCLQDRQSIWTYTTVTPITIQIGPCHGSFASLSLQRPRFKSRLDPLEFVVCKVALRKIFLRVLWFSPLRITLPVLHTNSSVMDTIQSLQLIVWLNNMLQKCYISQNCVCSGTSHSAA